MPSATTAPISTAARNSASRETVAPSPSRNTPPSTVPSPPATDDEILGIASPRKPRDPRQLEFDFDAADTPGAHVIPPALRTEGSEASAASSSGPAQPVRADAQPRNLSSADQATPEPAHLRATFETNPDLRAAWHDAHAYRESFATPEAAREATALVADLNQMDALFFSRRPEDHATLARTVAQLDPAAFASLARAMNEIADNASVGARHAVPERDTWQPTDSEANADAAGVSGGRSFSSDRTARAERDTALPQAVAEAAPSPQRQSSSAAQSSTAAQATAQSATNPATAQSGLTNDSQLAFLHSANAAAVEGVIGVIESQVERLLPEGVAKNARTRVVGEIYRELDATLRSNPQFAAQLRDAFRSGSLDDAHQRAIVSLLTSRARQALPGVAKRVLNEWTSTIVSAANERRTRQRTAERRVDIAGSGGAANDGRRAMTPRDLDYSRLTDADILNL